MSSSPPPPLCKFLRAKTTGVHGDPAALWAIRDESSATFWCLLTMSPAGPDDRLVHVCDCGEERVCCVPVSEPPAV
jgi:hypothetical protein